jgi:hypothetical protein
MSPNSVGAATSSSGRALHPSTGKALGGEAVKSKVHVVGLDAWPVHQRAFVVISFPLSLL